MSGVSFATPFMFRRHVQETCQHEARVAVVVCRICHVKSIKVNLTASAEKNGANDKNLKMGNGFCSQEHEESVRKDRLDDMPQVLVDYRSVVAHIFEAHVRLFYRCTSCPRAFAKKEAIYEHRSQSHDRDPNCDKGIL